MKKQTLRKTACTVAVAMTFTGLIGCGRNENKQVTPEPTNTTTTETVGNSETSEVSDVTDEVVVVDVDITQYPWVLSHEFSEEEYLTLPAGAKFCGIDLPISKETIYSIPYSNHAFDSIEAAKDSPARNLSFRVEDSAYPNLLLDASEMTVGEVMDANQFSLSVTYLYCTHFGFSQDEFATFENAHDDLAEQEIFLDIMTTMYGAPNYFRYFASNKDTKTMIYDLTHPEDASNNVNNTSCYQFVVGWQFEDFGITAYFSEGAIMNSAGYSNSFPGDMCIGYFPIETGTIEEHYRDLYGDNVVSELVAERKNAFGDVEFLGPDPAVQELVINKATASDDGTSTGTTNMDE